MTDNLKNKTVKGLVWGLFNNGTTQVLNLVFGIILARLLTPSDYGIVGVLTVFSLIAGNIQSGGFTQGLCNIKKPKHNDYNSVFWFNIVMSATIYLILFICAPLISQFFHTPELLWLSRLVFLVIPFSALSIIANAYMFKNLMVKETAIVGIISLISSGFIGIILACLGYRYWALAWQQVSYSLITTICRYHFSPFRPSFNFTLEPIKKMFSFSFKLMITTILNSFSQNILTLIFGKLFPMHIVGIYSQANKWSTMASTTLQGTIAHVAQPVLANVRDDNERSVRVLSKLIRFTSFISFPAMLGLAYVSEDFILTTIGYKWLSSAEILRIITIAGSVLPIYAILQNMLISNGRSDIYLWLNVINISSLVSIIYILKDSNMETMIIACSAFTIVYLFLWFAYTHKIAKGYTLIAFFKDTLPFALTAEFSIMATHIIVIYLFSSISVPCISLLLKTLIAATIYISIMYLCKVKIMKECVSYLHIHK